MKGALENEVKLIIIGLKKTRKNLSSYKFTDNAVLYFMEFVDVGDTIEKYKYSYHYEDIESTLIFRYDVSPHFSTLQIQNCNKKQVVLLSHPGIHLLKRCVRHFTTYGFSIGLWAKPAIDSIVNGRKLLKPQISQITQIVLIVAIGLHSAWREDAIRGNTNIPGNRVGSINGFC